MVSDKVHGLSVLSPTQMESTISVPPDQPLAKCFPAQYVPLSPAPEITFAATIRQIQLDPPNSIHSLLPENGDQ